MKLAAAVRNRWPPIEIILTSGYYDVKKGKLPVRSVFFCKPYNTRACPQLPSVGIDLEMSCDIIFQSNGLRDSKSMISSGAFFRRHQDEPPRIA